MKALKIIIVVILFIALVAGIGTWWLTTNVDRLAGEAVKETAEDLLDTGVSLGGVEVDLARGAAIITGLRVANPPGYSGSPALLFGAIEVDISLRSLGQDVLVIEQVQVTDVDVSFELNDQAVSNISVLEANLERAAPSAAGDQGLLIIERADFRGGTITATSTLQADQELTFAFPVVSFTDLGAPGGATAGAVGDEIAAVLMDRIMDAAARAGVGSVLDIQKERAVEGAAEKLREKVDEILGRDDDDGG
jgi:hypothetical protein